MSTLGRLKGTLERAQGWRRRVDDVETGLLLAEDDAIDPAETQEILSEADQTLGALRADLERWDVESLLNGPYDQAGCRLYITAGVGGTDACDWAGILMRMYQR